MVLRVFFRNFAAMKTAIVGGGAAGFFLAINLKEMCPAMEVTILERSLRVLAKVAVSGGGRCNCTNSFRDVRDLSEVYPRGHRLLKRLFNNFDYHSAYQWFEKHGVSLVTQDDQCVFPAVQDSRAIINCFMIETRRLGIEVKTGCVISSLDEVSDYDFVAVTTGGQPQQKGLGWLTGHEIVKPVPSLFTLSIADDALCHMMGVVVEPVTVAIPGTKMRAEGPLLITHWGMSGPAILKLSSYAARYLHDCQYQTPLAINWTSHKEDEVRKELTALAGVNAQKLLTTICPFGLPSRLWAYLVEKTLGQRGRSPWGSLNQKETSRLVNALCNDTYQTAGRTAFKDEFVTCGGIALSAVNPSTLESRTHRHLYFAGEVLDIDGITGGFNFQAAWTTAYTVARAITAEVSKGVTLD